MLYSDLVNIYHQLEKTPKRLEKTKILSDFLITLPEQDIQSVVLLLQGFAFPIWDDRKLGLADKLTLKAITKATGKTTEHATNLWKELGDLGATAEQCTTTKSQATLFSQPLTITKVHTNLQKIAALTGDGATDQKTAHLAELLTSATPQEAKYITRTALGDLRIGLGEGTLRDAITWSCFGAAIGIRYNPEDNDLQLDDEQRITYQTYTCLIQSAYDKTTDFATVLATARNGEDALKELKIKPGQPLNVMLYQKAESIPDAFERVGKPASIEYKYDGFHILIHKKQNSITLFTRRLENVTVQFPDVVKQAQQAITANTAILEAEIVGYDPSKGIYLPFQLISARIQRKYDIENTAIKYPVHTVLFDLIYLEDKDCTPLPYKDRQQLLTNSFTTNKSFYKAKSIVTCDEEQAGIFYKEALTNGVEGIMAKNLDSKYMPGSRVGFGVKIKTVMEPVDAVVVGAEWGEGKRNNWLSSFTIACKHHDEYLTIGNVGTGLKEKKEEGTTFADMTELLQPHITATKGKEVIIKPNMIIEVHYEEIQQSPSTTSGYALRFPRFIRLRPDKRKEDITTLDEIKQRYQKQRGRL